LLLPHYHLLLLLLLFAGLLCSGAAVMRCLQLLLLVSKRGKLAIHNVQG
jgi:hypothetical protein